MPWSSDIYTLLNACMGTSILTYIKLSSQYSNSRHMDRFVHDRGCGLLGTPPSFAVTSRGLIRLVSSFRIAPKLYSRPRRMVRHLATWLAAGPTLICWERAPSWLEHSLKVNDIIVWKCSLHLRRVFIQISHRTKLLIKHSFSIVSNSTGIYSYSVAPIHLNVAESDLQR